jgi:hypothetical protein
MTRRADVVFLAWTRTSGRSKEIANALGGEAVCIFPARVSAKRLFAVRYAYSLVASCVHLMRHRPRALIATNPPVFPALMACAYAAMSKTPYVLDSHPTSFGAKGHTVSQKLLGVHRWLARRASATMVTTNDWVGVLESWGARGIVVHEAPPLWAVEPLRGAAKGAKGGQGSKGVVLFVGIFASDEPVMAVVEAARLRPDLEVQITGDLTRCPPAVLAAAPPNVRFLGYLAQPEYRAAVEAADVVVALTTEPTSIVRAGYEAIYSRRPLIITDWPAGRDAFGFAVYSANDAAALAVAFDDALSERRREPLALEAARDAQLARWNDQLHTLRQALQLAAPNHVGDSSKTIAVLS